MTITAKPITDNFWILFNDNDERIGIVQENDIGVILTLGGNRSHFKDVSALTEQLDITFNAAIDKTDPDDEPWEVDGYETSVRPFNKVVSLEHNLPVYTKTAKSNVMYCAGYYILKFESNGWTKTYCPKLNTMLQYVYRGPYKTEMEMQEQLRLAKHET